MEKFSDEYKRKLATLLRDKREAMGLSQIKLAEELGKEEEDRWICSDRYLRDIEAGRVVPSRFILEKLMDALDIDILEWDQEQYREVRVSFDNECESIIRLIFARKYDEAYEWYLALEKEEYYDKNKLHYKQYLKYLEASLLVFKIGLKIALGQENISALEVALLKAIEAIRLSKPSIQKKNGDIDTLYIEQNVFNLVEYRLIGVIANCIKRSDRMDEAKGIYESVLKSLEGDLVDEELQLKLIPLFSYNISNILLDHNNEYKGALEICQKGIHYSSIKGINEVMPYLKYNEGKALWGLKEPKDLYFLKSHKCFKESRMLFELMGDLHNAGLVRALTYENYGLHWYD